MTPQAIRRKRSPCGVLAGYPSTSRNATTNRMANMSVRARPDCSRNGGDSAMAMVATRATAQSTERRSSRENIAATAAPESDNTSVNMVGNDEMDELSRRHVDRIARRMRLVLGKVEAVEREREIDRVPVVEPARPRQGRRQRVPRLPWLCRAVLRHPGSRFLVRA
jgi:hypothetical protein